jgi:hypothetical protein
MKSVGMKVVRSGPVMFALGVALLVAPLRAQDSAPGPLPKNYQTVFENSAVAVVHAHYDAHEKIPVHDHSKFATVYVYLSDSGPVLFSHVEAKPFTATRPPVKMGSYRVSPGRIEKHSSENQGDTPTDFLRVELKQVPVRHFAQEYRGTAPASLDRNSDVVEFGNSDVATERIVCMAGAPCAVKVSPSPSVLIAFTPTQVFGGGRGSAAHVKLGTVRWIPAGQSVSIQADSQSAAHVLRVLMPSSVATEDSRPTDVPIH